MKKFLIGVLIVGTCFSVALLVRLLYQFVTVLQTLSGG